MEHWSVQIISLIGAFIVLTAYAGHQLKIKFFDPDKYIYNFFNFIASTFLVYVAFHPIQAGFIVMEGAWGLISLYSLFRIYLKNREIKN
jgi:hypothetical protein